MQIRTAISLDSQDNARPSQLAQALNLVGGKHAFSVETDQRGREIVAPELKPFNKISANDFTVGDVKDAIRVLRDRRDAIYEEAAKLEREIPDNEFDRRRAETWIAGLRANADLAMRLAEEFETDLTTDIENSGR